jgi:8-oxo-dGTP pyrophosphatase MutT (NUDIX family)
METPAPHDPGDEIGVLVDADDTVIGQATRREIRAAKLLHRGVAILTRNGAGDVYVHRRTTTKDVFPGLYDMWVGGMVEAGEDYESTAVRELAEELGITGAPLRRLFTARYDGPDNPNWSAVFEVEWDGPIVHQPEEIDWGAFMPVDGIEARMAEWPFVPDGTMLWHEWRARQEASRTSTVTRKPSG